MSKLMQHPKPNMISPKKQSLVQTIKKNLNRQQQQQSPKFGRLKKAASKPDESYYQSLKNTVIDYGKDHNADYGQEYDDQVDPYDQTTAQFGLRQNHSQEIIQEISSGNFQINNMLNDQGQFQNDIDEYYDQNIMNQIQMELYEDQNNKKTPVTKTKTTNIPNNSAKLSPVKNTSVKSNGKNQKSNGDGNQNNQNNKVIKSSPKNMVTPSKNPPTNPQLHTRNTRETLKRNNNQIAQNNQIVEEQESQVQPKQVPIKQFKNAIVPSNGIQKPSIQPLAKPTKRLNKSDNNQTKSQPINFNLLIRPYQPVKLAKRVIRCLSDNNQIQDRSQARFLIQLMNEDQIELSNTEMVYLYKDILIDYYQGIHFS